MTTLARVIPIAIALAACGGDESGLPKPIAKVPGTLKSLAVNDASLFGIDATNAVIEVGLDGTLREKLPTRDVPSEVVAQSDWVAWIEVEGSGKIIRRRRNGMFESMRPFTPHIV